MTPGDKAASERRDAGAVGRQVAEAWAMAAAPGAGERLGVAMALVQIIAAETSLLALDATIEAARAAESSAESSAESGTGSIAAAAGDVRSLAGQMTNAADQAQRITSTPAACS